MGSRKHVHARATNVQKGTLNSSTRIISKHHVLKMVNILQGGISREHVSEWYRTSFATLSYEGRQAMSKDRTTNHFQINHYKW